MSTLMWCVPAVIAAVLLMLGTRREDRAEMAFWFGTTWGTGLCLLTVAWALGWWTP